jgi:5-amino-6-(5-phospho-D-ribitylamino)uracil phosphatase
LEKEINHHICSKPTTLYVSDLDGTLLNSDSLISPRSAEILNELIGNGVMFTIATARTPATVVPLLGGMNLNLPAIVMAGAAMWDNSRKDYLNTNAFDEETVGQVCSICEDAGIHPFVYRRHKGQLEVHHFGAMSSTESNFVEERSHSVLKRFVLDEPDYVHSRGEALLIFTMNEYERLMRVYERISSEVTCSSVCYHDIFGPETGLMEVYSCGTSKAEAIRRLANDVNADRIVVFGDNLNDLPMLEIADYSVATANAVEDVRNVADEVIGCNDADSVALWIQHDAGQYPQF